MMQRHFYPLSSQSSACSSGPEDGRIVTRLVLTEDCSVDMVQWQIGDIARKRWFSEGLPSRVQHLLETAEAAVLLEIRGMLSERMPKPKPCAYHGCKLETHSSDRHRSDVENLD